MWNDVIVSDSALSQAIRTLRRALDDDPRDPRFIRTVSRHGYQFVFADVVEESDSDEAVPRAPMAALVGRRLQQAAGSTPVQWANASVGGGVAGILAGAAGGLLLVAAPGNMAPLAVVPVLAMTAAPVEPLEAQASAPASRLAKRALAPNERPPSSSAPHSAARSSEPRSNGSAGGVWRRSSD